jgi:BAG domain
VSVVLLLLAFTLIPMSRWTGFWSGAGFSPFGSSRATRVTDSDFPHTGGAGTPRRGYGTYGPLRSPTDDSLVLRHGKVNYPLHFPASSISDGGLKIGELRREAARAIDVQDPSRVRLLYKGKNLKDDSRTCLEEGLRAGSELMCMASEIGGDNGRVPECEGSETEGEDGEALAGGDQPKKKKNRNRKKKNKKPTANAIGISSPSQAPAAPTPKTALDKLNDISSHFHTKLYPLCVLFTSDPPTDPVKRELEHRKLTETIFSDVMLMLDAVETEGDPDARQRRKDLVKETQGVLSGLDAVLKVD